MRRNSLCQSCFCSNCAWHTQFKPVEGWTAIPTKIIQGNKHDTMQSFNVIDCPMYTPREQDKGYTEVSKSDFAELLNISYKRFISILYKGELAEEARKRGYVFKTYGDTFDELAWFVRRI